MVLTFKILGSPVPQHRPRFARAGKFVRTYNVKEDTNYREKLYWEARQAVKAPIPRSVPLVVELSIYRKLTKAVDPELAEMGLVQPNTRPDIDNYIKQVLDGLNGIVWEDDGQIVRLVADKWYSASPRLEITVRTLDHTEPQKKRSLTSSASCA